MPPRRKIVKKTVRKAKPKTQCSPPPSPSCEPVPEAEAEAEAEPLPVSESSLPPANDFETETPVPALTEPATDASFTEETLASEPISNETLESKPAAEAEAATITVEKEPEPAATGENLTEEPAATEPTGSEAPPEEPAAAEALEAESPAAEANEEPSETLKKQKTVTRVRKVVKKKIVKKLVPKAAAAMKEESKLVQEAPKVEEAAAHQNSNDEQGQIEKPSSDDAPAPFKLPEMAILDTKMEDAKIVEDVPKGEEKGVNLDMEGAGEEGEGVSERSSRKKTEIFIGGLDRNAKEGDLRKVFGEVGEIVEVRMIMDGQSGKNKGYAFLRYADASQAKKAVAQFEKVEVCGKLCGASALKGNDTIVLGNIDKKWKKDDIIKLLQEVGIEKIEAVTVMPDSNNADSNRGFAFLELETKKDAQYAYKKLQKKDAFGNGRNIKVAWAEPLNDPDEEEMKVKSVYAEGIPASWDEEKVRASFKTFGEIERIVLARNIKSSKRKDFAFVNYKTREAAISCIESFDKEKLTDNGSKVNVKVSLAKPVQKSKQSKQNKGASKSNNKDTDKEKPKAVQRDTKAIVSSGKGKSSGRGYPSSGDMSSSTSHELLHVLREQAAWRRGQIGYAGGPPLHDYAHVGGKRPFSTLEDEASYLDIRGYPRTRLDSFPSTGSSYEAMSHGTARSSHPYYQHQGTGYAAGAHYGATDYPASYLMRHGAPYGSNYHSRY